MTNQDDKCAGCDGCDDLIQEAHTAAHVYTQSVIRVILQGKTPHGNFIKDSMSETQKATVARSVLAGVLRAVAESYVDLEFITPIAMMEFSEQLLEAELAEAEDDEPDELIPDEVTLEGNNKPN